jgi:hypothetical protein
MTKIFPTRQTVIALNLTTNKEVLFRGRPSELLDQMGPVARDSAVTVVIEGYRVGSHRKKMNRRCSALLVFTATDKHSIGLFDAILRNDGVPLIAHAGRDIPNRVAIVQQHGKNLSLFHGPSSFNFVLTKL